MAESPDYIAQLIIKQLNDEISQAEKAELQTWIDKSENNKKIAEQFLIDQNLLHGIQETYRADEAIWTRVKESIGRQPAKVRKMRPWFKWAVAAILLFVAGSVWFVVSETLRHDQGERIEVAKVNDVPAPKDARAVIVLADGSKVYLDSVRNGTVAQQSNVVVTKTAEGKIVYSSEKREASSELVYNTINNPRGSKVIDMQLSDGSHVWLNAGSSLKYPVAFIANKRKVEVTGEAYFEVTHDASKPFVVSKDDVSVTVLGTHFNVNAYDDENALKVTLLEGSVRVSANKNSLTIQPGTQAVLESGHILWTANKPDLEEVMAWKNGLFSFNRADIKTVMRELARWYDLDIEYHGAPTSDLFGGDIRRDLPLSKALNFLEKSQVHFKVEGRKITVMP